MVEATFKKNQPYLDSIKQSGYFSSPSVKASNLSPKMNLRSDLNKNSDNMILNPVIIDSTSNAPVKGLNVIPKSNLNNQAHISVNTPHDKKFRQVNQPSLDNSINMVEKAIKKIEAKSTSIKYNENAKV